MLAECLKSSLSVTFTKVESSHLKVLCWPSCCHVDVKYTADLQNFKVMIKKRDFRKEVVMGS